MMEGKNESDKLYEYCLSIQEQLEWQLHQYALDREVDESDSVVKDIKKKLAHLEEAKTLLAPKTTRYKNK